MESNQFDALTARLAARATRREGLGLLALLGAAPAGLMAEPAAAKKRRKKGRNKKKPGNRGHHTTPPPPAPTCTDGIRNGDETDVDCGGSCPPCAVNQRCQTRADCANAFCEGAPGNRVCTPCPNTTQCGNTGPDRCFCGITADDNREICFAIPRTALVANCTQCAPGDVCIFDVNAGLNCFAPCRLP